VKVRPVQGNLVLEVTACDDSALPGAVALEVEQDTTRCSGLGLDGLLVVRCARDERNEGAKIEQSVELTMPSGCHVGALGTLQVRLPWQVRHGNNGNEGIDPHSLLFNWTCVRDRVVPRVR
jgi:hypothetical protein